LLHLVGLISPTCRDDWVQINKPKIFFLLVINYEIY